MSLITLSNVAYAFLLDITMWQTSFANVQILGAFLVCFFNLAAVYKKIREEKLKQKQTETNNNLK